MAINSFASPREPFLLSSSRLDGLQDGKMMKYDKKPVPMEQTGHKNKEK